MKRAAVGAFLALSLTLPGCTSGHSDRPASTTSALRSVRDSVRVGVWMSPDPNGATYGAAATRSLIYPQLFTATPAGRWQPDLVRPGTDRTSRDAKSATFRLRPRARWSDGAPITAEDLRRTADGRFVQSIDGPTRGGTIHVHFTQPLPGWRRLWSGLDAIRSRTDGVYGGPFRVASQTTGLETVLTRNETYYGTVPVIRHLHLVFAPDPEIATRLLERGELDVVAPPAFGERTHRLDKVKNAHVLTATASSGGWVATLIANPARLSQERRAALFGLVNRQRFTDVLLHDEADAAGPSTAADLKAPAARGNPSILAPVEEPQFASLLHAMQRLGRERGLNLELRQADFDQVLASYASGDFDVVVQLQPPSPQRCWVCEAATVNRDLAVAADSGDRGAARQLAAQLETDGLVLPLWRERAVVAVRDGLEGVVANGFTVSGPVWNAAAWRWKS